MSVSLSACARGATCKVQLVFKFLVAEFDCARFAHKLAHAKRDCGRKNEQAKHYADAYLPIGDLSF